MTQARFGTRTTPPHIATLTLMAGISALSMSVFLPSLNDMAAHFGVDYGVIQLAVPLYLVALAGVQMIGGPISDRYGRRPVALIGLALFVLATLGCILAPSASTFLMFRIFQSVIATSILLSRAIVRDVYETAEAASKLGYVIMGMSIVPMIGPAIGGALAPYFGWQGSFYLLILAAGVVFGIVWLDLPETHSAREAAQRPKGERRELLRSQRFWAYLLTATTGSGAYFALLGGASKVASGLYGLTQFQAGLALGVPALGYMFGNWIAARYTQRVGLDKMVLWGAAISAAFMVGSWGLGMIGHHGLWAFFGMCTGLGVGNGLVMPNTAAGMMSVRPHLSGTASGLGGAAQILGGAALAATSGFLLQGSATALPLQAVMALSALASLGFATWAWRRTQILSQGAQA